jgi:hypothetical protein
VAFVAPAVEDFLDRFPEFAEFDEGQIQLVLDEVAPMVDEEWIERDRPAAILYLAAHLIYSQQQAGWMLQSRVTGSSASGGTTAGPVLRETVGPLSVMYTSPKQMGVVSQSGGAVSASSFDLESSPYGLRYLELLRLTAPAVLVV